MTELSALDAVVRNAARVRLAEVRTPAECSVDLAQPGERDRLRAAMVVESLPGAACACAGDVRFEFVDSEGASLADAVLHHGVALRWDGWQGLAVLQDGGLLLRWLDEHSLRGPLRQAEEAATQRQKAAAEEAAWLAAAPPALRELVESMLRSELGVDLSAEFVAEARELLWRAVPDPVDRVLSLLVWCGSGSGRLSGYPSHEKLPDLLLRDVPIAEIIAGLQAPHADGRHTKGAVRHLRGWRTRRKQKRDLAALPEELKARLLI
ncbi:hypothetical protein [Actinocrispum sp. NPDC049592]|uniref:hypothetical protein n=1 Tax=Actinocrispum sp. NPDC049592 TaxID=3154835 RepID=UPI0034283523